MSHQARVRSNCPEALHNTSLHMHEALPWGKVLPGHPENQDQALQASQALQLIPEREQRDEGRAWVKRVVWALQAQVVSAVWRKKKTSDICLIC